MEQRRLLLMLMVSALVLSAFSAEPKHQRKENVSGAAGVPPASLININQISAWVKNNGVADNNPFTGNSGMSFPRGTSTAIFSSGLIFGAFCNDAAMASNQPRVVGSSYNSGFAPGAILGLRTGVVENASDPGVRIWRIRRDYAVADLKNDAAEYYLKTLDAVTAGDQQLLREQYKKDWQEWPASKGAPFYDANNDGIYTPQFQMVDGVEVPKLYPAADEPGTANGDQVVWYVCNDLGAGDSPWKTKPMGLEQQVTMWGYSSPGVTGNIIFKKFKLIYKGTSQTPVNGKLTDAYVCYWSDPDLGDAGDDFVGCDTSLSLGYVYNGTGSDKEYQRFGATPPAVGFDFLQGPVVPSAGDTAIVDLKKRPGFRNLPMSSFVYFAAGGMYSDPPFTLNGSWQWYSMLMGCPPTPQGPPFPRPIVNPVTGDTTTFWLNGDPLTKTGWVDGYWEQPGDRRMLQTAGPFTMSVGDTQEVVLGVVAAVGESALRSVALMKENDRYVQSMYNSLFKVVPPSVSASVSYPNANATITVKATSGVGLLSQLTATVKGTDLTLYDDGTHGDGGAGDGLYANALEIPRQTMPVPVDIAFTAAGGAQYRIAKVVEQVTVAGPVGATLSVLFDNINNDKVVNNGEYVHFGVTVQNNTGFDLTEMNIGYGSSVDLNGERSIGAIAAGQSRTVPYDPRDGKTFFAFRLPMTYAESTYPVTLTLRAQNGNLWSVPLSVPVVKQTFLADSIPVVAANVIGQNDGQVGFVLYNPAAAGEVYDLWYGQTSVTQNWTVVKSLAGSDYATVTATLSAKNEVPSITTLPAAGGTGTFTLNDAKTTLQYSVSVNGLTGAVTGANIHRGMAGTNGAAVHPLSFSGSTASGTWNIPDSLVKELTAGNLYVNVLTAANPNGEVRGAIADGMLPRQNLSAYVAGKPIFQYPEQILPGFSLYMASARTGSKSVQQTAPTVGNVKGVPNPENTYRLVDSLGNFWSAVKFSESPIEIRFTAETNWALSAASIPAQSYPVKVPFAVYKDTMRVFPIIRDLNKDSVWNSTGNAVWNGKPVFDRIVGIVDGRDAANNDISYYSPLNTAFPPTANAQKGRLINAANHILSNVDVVNEQSNGIAPANGTKILFSKYISVKPGDIKRITLTPLGVETVLLNTLPADFALQQNYPNPFNPSTRIRFSLPAQTFVSLKVYDIIGREVATLMEEVRPAGTTAVTWNGENRSGQRVASGVYFYRMEAGSFRGSKKMLLLK